MNAYEPSHVKRARRTNAQLADLDTAIVAAVEADSPISLRGVYYRVVSAGAVPKTDAGYRAVMARLKALRQDHVIDYNDIVDGTRTQYRTTAYGSAHAALERTARTYRQQLWDDQDDAVIFVSEKDAISGVVAPIAVEYQVPLIVLRGYSSLSANYGIADDIDDRLIAGKTVYVYQLGDHDASGVNAWEAFQESVTGLLSTEFGKDASWVSFDRLAVTAEQIEELALPTRPGKTSDTRAAAWGDRPNVEVDAIPPSTLRGMVRDTIESHIDADQLALTKAVEGMERATLTELIDLTVLRG